MAPTRRRGWGWFSVGEIGEETERGERWSKKGGGWAEAEATDESKQMLSRFQL